MSGRKTRENRAVNCTLRKNDAEHGQRFLSDIPADGQTDGRLVVGVGGEEEEEKEKGMDIADYREVSPRTGCRQFRSRCLNRARMLNALQPSTVDNVKANVLYSRRSPAIAGALMYGWLFIRLPARTKCPPVFRTTSPKWQECRRSSRLTRRPRDKGAELVPLGYDSAGNERRRLMIARWRRAAGRE